MNHSHQPLSVTISNANEPAVVIDRSDRLNFEESRVNMNLEEQQRANHDDDVASVASQNNDDKQSMIPLADDFVPGDKDVICGRGKKCYAHAGNVSDRSLCTRY